MQFEGLKQFIILALRNFSGKSGNSTKRFPIGNGIKDYLILHFECGMESKIFNKIQIINNLYIFLTFLTIVYFIYFL